MYFTTTEISCEESIELAVKNLPALLDYSIDEVKKTFPDAEISTISTSTLKHDYGFKKTVKITAYLPGSY